MTDHYQELSLVHYVRIVMKRKKLIALIAVIVFLLSGLVYPYSLDSLYETESTLLIGSVANELVELKEQTTAIVLTEATVREMLASIDPKDTVTKSDVNTALKNLSIDGRTLDKIKTTAELEAEQQTQRPANFIRIIYKDSDPERAVKGVTFLEEFILKRHKTLYDEKRKLKEERLARTKKYLDELYTRIGAVEKTMSDLTNLRYPAGYAIAQGASITVHVELRNKLLGEARSIEEALLIETVKTKEETTTVISPPITPIIPVEQAPVKLRIGIVVVLGFFLGVIGAFCIEWWSKNRDALRNV